jgi:myo-inositol-1(or 4)-monophosphatase
MRGPLMHDIDSRLQFAVELAEKASELGSRCFREIEPLTIESKGDQNLVSNGGREVEPFIRAALR